MFTSSTVKFYSQETNAAKFFSEAEFHLRGAKIHEALALYTRAEHLGYDADACAGARWICHMLLGDFEAAWCESDAIAARGSPDPNRFWDGQPPEGRRVLVRCLHGLGDTLQFIRYAPLLRARAKTLTIETQPELKALLEAGQLADAVITWGEPEPAWDQQVEVVELPRIFRTGVATIPQNVPYISVGRPAAPTDRRGEMRIGLVWASSAYNPARSLPLEAVSRLSSIPGAKFFSLQADPERGRLASCRDSISDAYDESGCVLSAARTLKTLDLLIAADTMMAHLAGAMGLPVWTLLPFQCDWRWMLHRRDSPWYPTMRLFRQPEPGDWDSVIEEVRRELTSFIAAAER